MPHSRGGSHFALEKENFSRHLSVCTIGFHDMLREKPFSLFMLSEWRSFIIALPMSGFYGQDSGALKPDAVP
jgi:hypothetical protein